RWPCPSAVLTGIFGADPMRLRSTSSHENSVGELLAAPEGTSWRAPTKNVSTHVFSEVRLAIFTAARRKSLRACHSEESAAVSGEESIYFPIVVPEAA
ncbi:MAG: hypothetical protein ACRD18_01505, partial [Terriglobia bacterium]